MKEYLRLLPIFTLLGDAIVTTKKYSTQEQRLVELSAMENALLKMVAMPIHEPTSRHLEVFDYLRKSCCLKQALKAVKLEGFPELAGKVHFTQLSGMLGYTTYGGHIFLDTKLTPRNSISEATLLITLSHEIAHVLRRYKSTHTDLVSRSPKLELK